MKPTIKKLWFEYLQEKSKVFSEQEKKISKKLYELAEVLGALLNNDQKKKFEEYCDVLTQLYSLEQYEAFEKGVVFTTRFLTEAAE